MIGERIKMARTKAGLSMQALGEKVGVSAYMVKKYESNRAMPSSAVLIKLAEHLSVRAEYFFRAERVYLEEIKYCKKRAF